LVFWALFNKFNHIVHIVKGENKMTRKIMFMLLISFFSLALLSACSGENKADKSETDVTYSDVKKGTKEAMETAKDYTQKQKEEYLRQMNAKLEEFEKEIQDLQEKASSKASELKEASKEKFNQSMEALTEKKEAAAEKLEELKNASAEKWDDVKAGVDSAMDELDKTFEQIRSKFSS